VLALMNRIKIIPSHQMPLFAPRITVFTTNGRSYTKQATGREFIWSFDEEARRIRGVEPALPIPVSQFAALIEASRTLPDLPRADRLIHLTVRK